MTVLQAAGLVKLYKGSRTPALDGLDLAVEQGEVFGLLGPNGAGKTTAISILCGLLRPTQGEVRIRGELVAPGSSHARRTLGLVPQDIALYPTLTVSENLGYFGRMYGISGGLLRTRVARCLEMTGLEGHGDRRVGTLSGGMKRRANLAAGMVHEPSILLLDEPTVGVDAQSRNKIVETLASLIAADRTLVYTTHYMEEAERLCTRVAIVDGGRMLAQGRPADLVAATPGCSNLEEVFLKLTGKELRDE